MQCPFCSLRDCKDLPRDSSLCTGQYHLDNHQATQGPACLGKKPCQVWPQPRTRHPAQPQWRVLPAGLCARNREGLWDPSSGLIPEVVWRPSIADVLRDTLRHRTYLLPASRHRTLPRTRGRTQPGHPARVSSAGCLGPGETSSPGS